MLSLTEIKWQGFGQSNPFSLGIYSQVYDEHGGDTKIYKSWVHLKMMHNLLYNPYIFVPAMDH